MVCRPRRNALLKEGSKSDKVDARKLADLLRTGMLRPVYHGENGLRTLRELSDHQQRFDARDDLVWSTGRHIQRMLKALTQMNIRLANVISDITGGDRAGHPEGDSGWATRFPGTGGVSGLPG